MFRIRPFRTATIILTVATCLAISVFLLTRRTIPNSSSVHAQQPPIEPGSIDDIVQRANAEGRLFAKLPMSIMGEMVFGFDDASTGYSIVVAQAVSKQSFAVSAYDVETWYKFTVTETLSTTAPHDCVVDEDCSLPAELPAAGAGEMWLVKSGGVIVRNGVTVDFEEAGFPDFNIGQTYLLFVDLNQTTKVGVPAIAPDGVFIVDNNGNLASILGEESDLSSDISSRFGNSLAQLRNFLNPPPPPPSGCDPAQQQDCSVLSRDGNSISLNYAVQVEYVYKGKLKPGNTVTVSLPGGKIKFDDGSTAEVTTPWFKKMQNGKTYALFLQPGTGNAHFVTTGEAQGVFEIPTTQNDRTVKSHSGIQGQTVRKYNGQDVRIFLRELRQATGKPLKN